jgi:glycosyltransferase involved in cell wall biosynthesis
VLCRSSRAVDDVANSVRSIDLKISYLCLQATRQGQASYSHVHEIIKGLERRNCRVRLFQPNYVDGNEPSVIRRLWQFVISQVRLIFGGRPDVLYIRWHIGAWPTAFLARLRRIPVVQEINGGYYDLFIAWPATRKFTRLALYLSRSQLRWAARIIAVTPQLATWAVEQGGHRRVHFVSNGANTELFTPLAERPAGVQLPERYVIFFGALAAWQGVDTMLEAVESQDWPAGVPLVVVGAGAEASKVEAMARRSERVVYLGRRPQPILAGIIAHSEISLSTQVGERGNTGLFPLKLFESLACGVPVIVTDYPGMSDLVRQFNCGEIVAPGDAASLARAVAHLVQNPQLARAMGARGRDAVQNEYSWDRKSEETLHVLVQAQQ